MTTESVRRRWLVLVAPFILALALSGCAVSDPGQAVAISSPAPRVALHSRPDTPIDVMDQWCEPIPAGKNYIWRNGQEPVNGMGDAFFTEQPDVETATVIWYLKVQQAGPYGGVISRLADGTCRTDPLKLWVGTYEGQPAYVMGVDRYAGEELVAAWIVPGQAG